MHYYQVLFIPRFFLIRTDIFYFGESVMNKEERGQLFTNRHSNVFAGRARGRDVGHIECNMIYVGVGGMLEALKILGCSGA